MRRLVSGPARWDSSVSCRSTEDVGRHILRAAAREGTHARLAAGWPPASSVKIGVMWTLARVALVVLIAAGGLCAQADIDFNQRRDAAIQAFRSSPSLAGFSVAGEAIMQASDSRLFDGSTPRRPARHPDFEAMKATLAAGVMVSLSALPPEPTLEAIDNERVVDARQPAVRSSFFKRGEPLFVIPLRPFKLVDADVISLVDALSAVNRQPMRLRVAAPMSFGSNGPLGAWDVGAMEARFERDALVHGVGSAGQATGYNVRSVKAPVGWQPCTSNDGSVIGTRVNANWASATVAWIGRSAPGAASLTTRESGGSRTHDKLVNELIDLDRDGVPDFSTWSGIDKSDIVDDVDRPWKAVFVNVEGTWTLAAYRAAPDCT